MGTLNAAAYLAMLQSKITMHRDDGVRIARSDINPMLKPHQLDIVEWACRKGRAVELNAEYYRDAVRGMKLVERECSMPSLFDMLSVEAAE